MPQPSLTVVAGPNGSGKTTLIRFLHHAGLKLHGHLNADDIAATLGDDPESAARHAQGWVIDICESLLIRRTTFSYETVLSHPSHLDRMARARAAGYFVRLIFVATDAPAINIARVADRVAKGGHDVPTDRLLGRYERTMHDSLFAAVCIADESMVFDNSFGAGGGPLRVAHVIGKFARMWPDTRIGWPELCLFSKIRADPRFVIAPD